MIRPRTALSLALLVVVGLFIGACGSDDADTAGADAEDASCPEGEQEVTDGLVYVELECGDGDEAQTGDTVSVHYTGTLEDGTEFDSSVGKDPFTFTIGTGGVIPGWEQGVPGMHVGGKRELTIAPELAYGDSGAGGVIPPGATLIFEIELLEITDSSSP
jgi:FKBP-type peptidyl-prolyl cis-trans isomerase FkpA